MADMEIWLYLNKQILINKNILQLKSKNVHTITYIHTLIRDGANNYTYTGFGIIDARL